MAIPTPHISAKKEDIAKTVLMPGDPLRSEFIAKNFLKNPVLVNDVRGVHGYTGEYNGKKVTVMASGMGQPSIGIYSYELYNFYDVDAIIRVGTCGSFHPDLHARDIIVAMGACTNGNYAMQYKLPGTFAPIADFDLVRRAVEECEKAGVTFSRLIPSTMMPTPVWTGQRWAFLALRWNLPHSTAMPQEQERKRSAFAPLAIPLFIPRRTQPPRSVKIPSPL